MTYLVFISTSTKLFNFFKCDEFVDLQEAGLPWRFLAKDYRIDCDGPEYTTTVPFALLGALGALGAQSHCASSDTNVHRQPAAGSRHWRLCG